MLYSLNLYSDVCQLFLNKTEKKKIPDTILKIFCVFSIFQKDNGLIFNKFLKCQF